MCLGRWVLLWQLFPETGFSWEPPDETSKLSDHWLFLTSNLSAKSLPKLVQFRLAEAAAASYALANGSEEVDENFCLDARLRSPQSVDFATECCDLLSFDTLGSDECFPSWPSWSVRVCCAYFVGKAAQFSALWKDVVTETPWRERKEMSYESNLSRGSGIVAYHKSGITLSSQLVGLSDPGPLSHLVLESAGDLLVPQNLSLENHGEHDSPRGGQPVIRPYYQAFIRSFADTTGRGMIVQLSNPLKSWKPQLQDLLAEDGAGLVLHLVRRPSDMIFSGYRYHGQQRPQEKWLYFSNPPESRSTFFGFVELFCRVSWSCFGFEMVWGMRVSAPQIIAIVIKLDWTQIWIH